MRPSELLPSSLADQVFRQLYVLHGAAQHELAGVEHEGAFAVDLDHLGQAVAVLGLPDVDVRPARVPEHEDAVVEMHVHAGGLDTPLAKGRDDYPAGVDLFPDGAVAEEPSGLRKYALLPRDSSSEGTTGQRFSDSTPCRVWPHLTVDQQKTAPPPEIRGRLVTGLCSVPEWLLDCEHRLDAEAELQLAPADRSGGSGRGRHHSP